MKRVESSAMRDRLRIDVGEELFLRRMGDWDTVFGT